MTEDERKEWRRMHPDGVDWSAFNDWQNPKGGEDVLPEWQRLHKELMKTDISGRALRVDRLIGRYKSSHPRLNGTSRPACCPAALRRQNGHRAPN